MTHPAVTDLYFIRHAPVIKREEHLPPHDPPIKDGPFDLAPLKNRLPKHADWHISPLLRTRQTADLLMPDLVPGSVIFDDRLVEMSFGDWHDQPVSDVWTEIADGPRHNWSFIMPETQPPGGESFASQCQRIDGWLNDRAALRANNPQIIVTHAGVISAALGHILGLPPQKAIGISVKNFAVLHVNLMEPERATDAGGPWQMVSFG